MSSSASWSYTATATLWVWLGRDDWTGVETFGSPQAVACNYSAKSERQVDELGVEFVTRQAIYTERADIKRRDRILIGSSGSLDPIAAGALEVRSVKRSADVFERVADDFKVMT